MEEIIIVCRLCGAKFKIYPMQVVRGDSSCCPKCNKEADDYGKNIIPWKDIDKKDNLNY